MDALVIEGPAKLKGTVEVSGSKNSALPLLFASLLWDKKLTFQNVPRLWDIETTLKILNLMGTKSNWDKEKGIISLEPYVDNPVAPYEWVRKMRAGILALGPLVAKCGEAQVSLPGGCAIGARPVNYHIDAMRRMGVSVVVENGYIKAQVPKTVKGTVVRFPQVTVTGTENIMMLASRAEGKTRIENAACEPEIVALGKFLQSGGVVISGLGTANIEVEGVSSLVSSDQPVQIPPDRIEAATWVSVALATGSPLTLENCDTGQMDAVLSAYRAMGAEFEISSDGTRIEVKPASTYHPIEVETQPYPGFPTDMQAQIMVNLCFAKGISSIRETIFENRFMHVAELRRFGAKINVEGNLAIVEGPQTLEGAPIMATDLRASASLVVAALAANGSTKISRIYHLDRGYQRLDNKLRSLGAKIKRITE